MLELTLLSFRADHRRVQRQQELQTMHATLSSLRDNKRYLSDQINSYHVYIDQSMAGIQKKSCVVPPHRHRRRRRQRTVPELTLFLSLTRSQEEAPRPALVDAGEPRASA